MNPDASADVNRYEHVVERLVALEEELRELAYDRLAARVRNPEGPDTVENRVEEKRLQRAARSLARAIQALRADS